MVSFDRYNWDGSNINNYGRWKEDNAMKTDEGLVALQAVMKISAQVASMACVRWIRDNYPAIAKEALDASAGMVTDRIVRLCAEGQDRVIADCAALYAGTGRVQDVINMAFVAYATIGVKAAVELSDELA